jgi:hypothetical protein
MRHENYALLMRHNNTGSERNDASGRLPNDPVAALLDVYQRAGLTVTTVAKREAESSEYGACRFGLDGQNVVFHIAKTTPTKIGQFVTIWKRPMPDGEIMPLDASDHIAFVVVDVSDKTRCGQFVFDQKVLVEKGVMSCGARGGKRAMRVYPPWTRPESKEASRTQQWQLRYFLSFAQPDGTADSARVRDLFRVSSVDLDNPTSKFL